MKPEAMPGTEQEEKAPAAVPFTAVGALKETPFAELVEQHRAAVARKDAAEAEAEELKAQIIELAAAFNAPKSTECLGTVLTQKEAGKPSYGIDKGLLIRENVDPEVIKRCTVVTRKGSAPSWSITHPKADKKLADALKPELA